MSQKNGQKVNWRPEHPDGEKYEFNCCRNPDVRKFEDRTTHCISCGYDWGRHK